ncbi:hypothetical protein BYT27DRAFT_6831855 [Phlegmacium glaucopus]|nr:hypothetical protein BYT27DRAFT_6831855 [Phlegmacium glaucopus]
MYASVSKIMFPILSSLSTKFNWKDATYCAIAIIGHLSFFLHQESPCTKDCLEQAAQIFQQSACDASVKQAIENIYIMGHVNHALLVEEAVQTVLNNLLSGN